MQTPRRLALCRARIDADERDIKLPAVVVFLGEIPNMPGHSVVADPDSDRVDSGYHINRFVELSKDDT